MTPLLSEYDIVVHRFNEPPQRNLYLDFLHLEHIPCDDCFPYPSSAPRGMDTIIARTKQAYQIHVGRSMCMMLSASNNARFQYANGRERLIGTLQDFRNGKCEPANHQNRALICRISLHC